MYGSLVYSGPAGSGQEVLIRVKNTTGNLILKGSLVSITGSSGTIPTVALVLADTSLSESVLAMANADISDGVEGFCTTFGSVGGLNTLADPPGTEVYLSATTLGAWTSTAPVSPNYSIHIGVVTYQHVTDGQIYVSIGPTNVAAPMVAYSIETKHDVTVSELLTLTPAPSVLNVTAAGGIQVTHTTQYIQGDGGNVILTANPQITAGKDGQLLLLHGNNDNQTVTIHNGDGLHLHSGSLLRIGEHDQIFLQYSTVDGMWAELTTSFKSFDTSWSFSSPQGFSGTYYVSGFYIHGSTSFVPAGGTNLGSALSPYAAHAFLVIGASSTDMVVRVTGTSINDEGTRSTSDFEDLDTSGGILSDYFETTKKWLGQVSFSLQSGTGVAINNGLCKYWDNQNSDFRLTGLEITGQAGANDANPDLVLCHHRQTGWTFNSGSEASPPSALASMQGDHSPEHAFIDGEPFAWKRAGLSIPILGGSREGTICKIVTTSNRAVEILNWTISVRPN